MINEKLNLQVRRMKQSDLAQVLSWRNHPSVRDNMTQSQEISTAEHFKWFQRCDQDTNRSLLIIEEQGLPIGFVQFNIQWHGIAEWGFYAVPESPPGTGTLLCRCALEHGFHKLKLKQIDAIVLQKNERSRHLHLRLGFLPLESLQNADKHYLRFYLPIDRWKEVHQP
jgi:UDP-4-amino-4,6-dideoxy-N-acetyl-beta-L-altrosamine N-acetyltransferase